MSLATIPDTYTPTTALLLFIVGALAIYANYAADVQRQQVRQSNGKCKVWGQPAKVIRASYTTGTPVFTRFSHVLTWYTVFV